MSQGTHRPQEGCALEVQLVGSFAVRSGGELLRLQPHAKRMVALLALRGQLERPRASGLLWPETSEERAAASLRTALWRLRRQALVAVNTDGSLLINPEVMIDLPRLESMVRACLAIEREDGPVDESWRSLLTCGAVLPGWYEDWIYLRRESFHQLRLEALDAMGRVLCARRRYGEALEAALAAVATEPLRESSHRAVLNVHLAQGNTSAARRYQAWVHRLFVGEGLRPSDALLPIGPSRP